MNQLFAHNGTSARHGSKHNNAEYMKIGTYRSLVILHMVLDGCSLFVVASKAIQRSGMKTSGFAQCDGLL